MAWAGVWTSLTPDPLVTPAGVDSPSSWAPARLLSCSCHFAHHPKMGCSAGCGILDPALSEPKGDNLCTCVGVPTQPRVGPMGVPESEPGPCCCESAGGGH